VRGPALARRDTAYDVRAVIHHLQGVKRAFFARDSLYYQPRVLIYEDAQINIS
jgi:hypothetical protein